MPDRADDAIRADLGKFTVVGEWLAESVTGCTCGTGDTGYGHEAGCGLEPVAKIADLLAAEVERPSLRRERDALLARAVAAEARAEKAERTLAAIPESPDYRLTMSCCWDARLHYFHTLQGATEEPKP